MKLTDSKVHYKRFGLRFVVTVMLAASILLVSQWGHSQEPQRLPLPGTVLSGNDIGFRLDGVRGNSVMGTFMVRIDGQWMAISSTPTARPLLK